MRASAVFGEPPALPKPQFPLLKPGLYDPWFSNSSALYFSDHFNSIPSLIWW